MRFALMRHSTARRAAAAERAAKRSLRPCLRRSFSSGSGGGTPGAVATTTALPQMDWAPSQPLSNLTDSSKGQLNAPFLARPEAVIFDKDGTLVVRSVSIN